MNIKLTKKDGELYFNSEKALNKSFIEITSIFRFDELQRLLERLLIDNMNNDDFAKLIDRKLDAFLTIKLDKLCSSIRITEAQSSTAYLYTKLTISVRKIFEKSYIYKRIEDAIQILPNYHRHDNIRHCVLHCFIENCNEIEREE